MQGSKYGMPCPHRKGMAANMDKPLVSILMGVYYKRRDLTFLHRSISSMREQTVTDFEFLICDDGSSQEAMAYLDEVAREDPRIRLIRQGHLYTLPEKLNACLKLAKGVYIARMDDDDYSFPQRLEQQLEVLKQNPELAFVGCNVGLVRDLHRVGVRQLPERPSVEDFYFVQPYIHPTLVFRGDVLREVGGYSQEKHCVLCEDYDLLLRLYAQGYVGGNLQEVLLDYTVAEAGKSGRKMKHRWNEAVTRFYRFRQLHVLTKAWPYVIKPLAVGMIPQSLVARLQAIRGQTR